MRLHHPVSPQFFPPFLPFRIVTSQPFPQLLAQRVEEKDVFYVPQKQDFFCEEDSAFCLRRLVPRHGQLITAITKARP